MKKLYIIFLTVMMFIYFAPAVLLGQWVQVVVDPGHGGPGASKYGPNGDGAGTDGPLPDGKKLSEEWVNLQVAFVLKDSIDNYCGMTGFAIMTRIAETEGVELPERAELANYANCDWDPVACACEEFISVHHNGLPLDSQGVETYWCNYDSVQIGPWKYDRNQTDVLARKIYYKLRDKFIYPPYTPRGCKIACFDVLRLTTMASTLSEGTNMHNDSEAILFDDTNLVHVKDEAGAIFRGWRSYYENNGIVTVANRGLCDLRGNVIVDNIDRDSPYYTCWSFSELTFHTMCAYEVLGEFCGGTEYFYFYHHWKELETGETVYPPYSCYSTIVNPSESTHTYIAYYRGGPYSVSLEFPNSGQFSLGDSLYIDWYGIYTSKGVDSTAVIDAYLDRHCGGTEYPEKILDSIPVKLWGAWWKVTGSAFDSCKIKLVSHDCVDNTASDTSDYWFSIIVPNIAGDCNSDGKIDIADVIYLANCVFCAGPCPQPRWKGDVDGSCQVNLGDAIYLANYVMGKPGAPAPWCNSGCPDWDCE